MSFKEDKAKYMADLRAIDYEDKSKKGSVDEDIRPLLEAINSRPQYYTTSSCAGRIVLLVNPESGKKHEAIWLITSHKEVVFSDVKKALEKSSDFSQTIFFKQEASILHVCCDSIESAQKLINTAKDSGFKRSGIMSTSKRIIVESMNTEKLEAPVAENKVILIEDEYLKMLIKIANQRLKITRDKIEKFKEKIIAF